MQVGLGIHAFAQELVLFDQVDFFGHPAQEQTQLFQRRKWFADVVVGAKLHGLHGRFNGAVTGHDRDFAARK